MIRLLYLTFTIQTKLVTSTVDSISS